MIASRVARSRLRRAPGELNRTSRAPSISPRRPRRGMTCEKVSALPISSATTSERPSVITRCSRSAATGPPAAPGSDSSVWASDLS